MDNPFHNWSFRMRIESMRLQRPRNQMANMMLCLVGVISAFHFDFSSSFILSASISCCTHHMCSTYRLATLHKTHFNQMKVQSTRSISDEMSPGTIINDLTSLFIAFDWFIARNEDEKKIADQLKEMRIEAERGKNWIKNAIKIHVIWYNDVDEPSAFGSLYELNGKNGSK